MTAPLRPQLTGRVEDFHSFNSRLVAYYEHYHVDEWLNREPQNRQERGVAQHTNTNFYFSQLGLILPP